MPYADNDGVKTYYEVTGKGPPLVMYTMAGLTHEWWKIHGYNEQLQDDYTLILLDPRGHGKSDKPTDPQAFTADKLVGDVTSILDDLGYEKAHFIGFSLGGLVGWSIGKHAPNRFYSLMIGGMPPYERDPEKVPDEEGEALASVYLLGTEETLKTFESWGFTFTEDERRVCLSIDYPAIVPFFYRVEHVLKEDTLASTSLPCLLYCGDKDPAYEAMKEAGMLLLNARFVGFSGLDHLSCDRRSDLIVPLIKDFTTNLPP